MLNSIENIVIIQSKMLSVDVEADIYNIALTCVINIRGNFEDWLAEKATDIDRSENYELKECTLDELREILVFYPENSREYHPSTYLRILMYHRYKEGTERTKRLLIDLKNRIDAKVGSKKGGIVK